MSVSDALGSVRITPWVATRLTISPDGKLAAFTVQERRRQSPDEETQFVGWTPAGTEGAMLGTDVMLVDLNTGALQHVTDGTGANWAPAWSPDGRHLAFFSDRAGAVNVWLWDRSTGKTRKLADVVANTLMGTPRIAWLPDGRAVLVAVFPEGKTVADVRAMLAGQYAPPVDADTMPAVTVYHSGQPATGDQATIPSRDFTFELSVADAGTSDLALIDIASGVVRRLVRRVIPNGVWISPTGHDIAFTSIDTTRRTGPRTFRLSVVGVEDGQARVVVPAIRQSLGSQVSWSPDGRWLSYLDGSHRAGGDCYIVDANGGAAVDVTPGSHPTLRSPRYTGPQWDAEGDAVYLIGGDTVWRADIQRRSLKPLGTVRGRTLLRIIGPSSGGRIWSPSGQHLLYVVTQDTQSMRMGVARIDIDTGAARLLFEEDRAYGSEILTDVSADAMVYVSEGVAAPPALWIAGPRLTHRRQLAVIDTALTKYVYGRSRLVTYRGLHGQKLTGVLLLPAGYTAGTRYPLIVTVYPRYHPAQALNDFGLFENNATAGLNFQAFATRGYAAFIADAPIRSGRFTSFDLAATVLPGVNRVIDLGIADSSRLGITGHSNGGYSTLALLTETPRFKAAVDRMGYSDRISFSLSMTGYGQSDGAWMMETYFGVGGNLWERRSAYIENSPVFHLDRVTTPVLLIHGTADVPVPVHLSDETFFALRWLGKTATYARYRGEGHGEVSFRYADARDELERILAWFDHYLGDAADGRTMPDKHSGSP